MASLEMILQHPVVLLYGRGLRMGFQQCFSRALFDIEDKDLMHKLFGHLDEDSKHRLWSNDDDDEEYD